MSIRKHGKKWQVRYPGYPTVSVALKADAERIETDYRNRRAMGHLYQARATTLGAELDRLVERKDTFGGKRGELSENGIDFYKRSIKAWEPLRVMTVPSLKRRHVEDHILGRAKSAPTAARNELQMIKQALRDARSRGQIVDEGIFDIDPITVKPKRGRALTIEELEALAVFMPERIQRIVPFVGFSGLRFSEATQFTDSMLDLEGAQLMIPAELNKSRVDKPIDLAKAEVTWLEEQMDARRAGSKVLFPTMKGTAYSKSGFRSVWLPALLKAGLAHNETSKVTGEEIIVADFTFHWMRHTAISLMAVAGMQPEMIAHRVGHKDGGALIFQRYRHLFPTEGKKAAALVDDLLFAARSSSDVRELDKAHA